MLMCLGQFPFTTDTLTFTQIQRQRTWQYAENSVAKGRKKRQFIGSGEDTVSLPGLIYQEHGFGNRFAIDDLAAMADTGQGFVLVDGSGYLYGVYNIDSIDETKQILLFDGVPRKIDFTIKLTRTDDKRIEQQSALRG
ncbi:phage tail protein [Acinetobacter modestus]|uniref:phage tail protein n=1 Tax=Acinetobacter modestus TaxID=1776740 RepID=UPI001F4AB1DE|nr:phage tail protein [Acinetobacter modestus]MCH7329635.1 phage tail protein [Acinetobacter modestus]MCH7334669.1 phage tail protein [Acinetobacter modestus]MCH7388191.1 phage tail protein [Acinetobacter modestus]